MRYYAPVLRCKNISGAWMLKHLVALLLFVLVVIGGTLLYAPIAVAAAENRDTVAVIIGNMNYTGSVPNVDFAHNDAAAIKRLVIVYWVSAKATSSMSETPQLAGWRQCLAPPTTPKVNCMTG